MLSLVPLTIEDGEILEKIHAACFPDGWSQKTFDHLLKENITCGWLANNLSGTPVGFILARILEDEAEILTFAVHPSSQRQGIGRHLLTELMNFLKSVHCTKTFLEVAIDNVTAINLYNSVGFKIVGSRPHYYQRNNGTFISASIMAIEN
jgi:ribosomal-protein-alanine N-acetyltransferase